MEEHSRAWVRESIIQEYTKILSSFTVEMSEYLNLPASIMVFWTPFPPVLRQSALVEHKRK